MVIKRIEVFADPDKWPESNPIPTSLLTLNGDRNINILEVLLHIALRTRPPLSCGISLGDSWAWMRYYPALTTGCDLKLRPEWEGIDSHQKNVLSDDFGVGIASSILTKAFNLIAICPTSYFVDRLTFAHLISTGKRGPNKSPDYVGVDGNYNLYIFECKGTQSDRDNIDAQFINGRIQKNSLIIDPPATVSQRLVTGFFIPQSNNKQFAYCKIEDPEEDEGIKIDGYENKDLAKTIIRGELASSFHLIGLPTLAHNIAKNDMVSDIDLQKIRAELKYSKKDSKFDKKHIQFVSLNHIFTLAQKIGEDENGGDQNLRELKYSSLEFHAGFDEEYINLLLHLRDVEKFLNIMLSSHLTKFEINDFGNKTIVRTALGLYLQIEVIEDL